MGNLYDALIELGWDDDPSTEIDLDRDVPDGILIDEDEIDSDDWYTIPKDEMELWVDSVIGEPEYLGSR